MEEHGKSRHTIWLPDETWNRVKLLYKEDNCFSQSEFVEKAIRFYDGYLHTAKSSAFLPKVLLDVLTTLMMLFLMGVFPYNLLWELGGKDDTKVRYKGKPPDPLRGLRIGILATIPSALLYIGAWIVKMTGKGTLYLAIYRITQIPYLPYINAVLGNNTEPGKLPVGGLLACALTLVFVPVVCAISYRLGFRKFSIKEHLTYKKTSDTIETPDSEI